MENDRTIVWEINSLKDVQKELRILSVLEPATQQHRLVVSSTLIEQDYKAMQGYAETLGADNVHHYSAMHQMAHLTRERDSLLHDDRLESLAGAVSKFSHLLGIDPIESVAQREADRMDAELAAFFEDADEIGQHTTGSTPRWDRTKTPIRPT